MDNFTIFNLVEGTVWLGIGTLFLFEKKRKMFAVAFILFGISDLVEISTSGFLGEGLWWLLLWKIISLAGLVFLAFLTYLL